MKKRIAICIFLIQLIAFNLSATVSLIMKHHDAAAGSQVTVPVRVKDFINIISVQGTISFDPSILSFASVQQFGISGMNAANFGTTLASSGKILFSWYESNLIPQTLSDSSILFSIKFDVIGTNGQVSDITFGDIPTLMEIVNNTTVSQNLNLVNGVVHINTVVTPYDLSLIVDKKTGNAGSQLSLPIKGVKFKNINSLQGTILFDPTIASFAGTGSYNLPGLSSSNFGLTQISSGKLMFSWNDATLQGQNISDSGTIFTVLFDLIGNPGDISIVSFASTPTPVEVTDSLSHTLNPNLISGQVKISGTPAYQQLTIDADSVTATTGMQVVVPIRAFDFQNLYSIQGTIQFNTAVATYAAVEQFGLSGMDISNFGTTMTSSGKLMFAWSDPALTGISAADSSILFAIRFNVIGSLGTYSDINFIETPTPSEFVDNGLNTLSYILKPGKIIVTSDIIPGHTISGKTRYAGKANAGNPIPNPPTYNSVIYDIDNVLVILKDLSSGTEIARDTSDNSGNYHFSNIADGNYRLYYDKITADTMQMVNEVTALDAALMKYFIGCDTNSDPSKNFGWIYKKAANVNNSASITALDVSLIKAKIGSPYDPSKNFPKGNWVNLDTIINVSGGDVNANLKIIGYGDFNASSTNYKDSANTWSLLKADNQNKNIIYTTESVLNTMNPDYFELPLKISKAVNGFTSLGLELKYPDNDFKLIYAEMQGNSGKLDNSGPEIITDNNDLLVTDHDGVIRVVFATTEHFDAIENEEIIRLGFVAKQRNPSIFPEFSLSGTGEIGNINGETIDDAYLLMPTVIFSSANANPKEFKFNCYPNPFNENAFISYNLVSDGLVNLSVYNILGESVSEIINEYQTSGDHQIKFSQNELPSGIYTFKLQYTDNSNNTNILTIKMIK